ncbi:ABC transporter permease [Caballeronia sp. LZ035]|uniref:ABC transporter permease n=1 Tax=Caballeronia sp. LZ035 TaxID=3038568 RepID=UPI00285C184C|nr:ABC transporter permease [Caballeronia sp. LZ035]MDR5760610.1 ABC transporter permease [Caballeronia sp. LZ035]
MLRFLGRRFAQSVATVLLVTVVIFIIVRLIGDPTHLMLPPEATDADRALLRHEMGLDQPVVLQYLHYLGQLVQGHLGSSYRFARPALDVVLGAIGPTLILTAASLALSILVGVPLGVLSAMRPGSFVDQCGKVIAVIGQTAPPFFFALIFIRILSVQWHWFPTGGYGSVSHLMLPALTLGWYSTAGILRLTRSSMTDVLASEYIKLARIKGVPERVIVWRHALRNALLPVITFMSLQFGILMGGAVSVEFVFAWPGIGRLILESISNLDYAVVQAAVTVTALTFTLVNLLVDILYAVLDPRIRYA